MCLFQRRRRSAGQEEVLRALLRIAGSLERIEAALGTRYGVESQRAAAETSRPEPIELEVVSGERAFLNDTALLEATLAARGFDVVELSSDGDARRPLDELAVQIGERYQLYQPLMLELKRGMNEGRDASVRLAELAADDINRVVSLARRMKDLALLIDVDYQPSPKAVLRAHVNPGPTAFDFVSGKWLERYVRVATVEALARHAGVAPVSFATNLKVHCRGKACEFDLMYVLGEELVWVEAKTGDYQHFIEKYAGFRELMDLEPEHAMLVVAGVSRMVAENLSKTFDLTVVPVEDFRARMVDTVARISAAYDAHAHALVPSM